MSLRACFLAASVAALGLASPGVHSARAGDPNDPRHYARDHERFHRELAEREYGRQEALREIEQQRYEDEWEHAEWHRERDRAYYHHPHRNHYVPEYREYHDDGPTQFHWHPGSGFGVQNDRFSFWIGR